MRDRRSDHRRKYQKTVHYSDSTGDYQGNIRDISASGVFITTDDPLEVGSRIALCFDAIRFRALLEGRVVRNEGQGMGVCFQNIKDENARLFHLT